jgi:RNA-directed DNA polymerase
LTTASTSSASTSAGCGGTTKSFVYTKPSKKAIVSIKGKVRTMTYRSNLHMPPADLLRFLGRMLRRWANYFRHGVAKATFSAVDSYAWERIASWLRRKHRIGWPALKRRFCVTGWRFAADGVTFTGAASVAITRYRYRGYRIPTPWTPIRQPSPTDQRPPHVESPVR